VIEPALRPPPHKSAYIFPNLLTAGNLFAGFYAIVAAMNLKFEYAAVAIIIAAFMDGLDGKVARMTGTSSRFGVEFDSLADLVSFGVAPAVLVYVWELRGFKRVGWVAAFLFVACGALRLARFNVQVATTEKRWFTGMPIPMAGGTLAVTVLFFQHMHAGGRETSGVLFVLLTYLLSFLMVSTVRYRSFKELETRPHKAFYLMVSVIILISLVAIHPQISLFSLAVLYLLSGPVEPVIMFLLNRSPARRSRLARVPDETHRHQPKGEQRP
jgi:CDP-diacylglycerol---serine O-phosphatidyltransferase